MGLFYLLDGKIMIEDLEEIWREMSEKKRVPPWERAQLSFTLAERRRLRKVEENERPGKARLLDLEENQARRVYWILKRTGSVSRRSGNISARIANATSEATNWRRRNRRSAKNKASANVQKIIQRHEVEKLA